MREKKKRFFQGFFFLIFFALFDFCFSVIDLKRRIKTTIKKKKRKKKLSQNYDRRGTIMKGIMNGYFVWELFGIRKNHQINDVKT